MPTVRYFLLTLCVMTLVCIAGCSGEKTEPNKFAGKYSGRFSGDSSGTWTAAIKKDGSVTAVMTDPDVGSFRLTGTISPDGKFAGGGGSAQINRVSWEGTFRIENDKVICSGTWKSSTGPFGTWRGERDS